MPQDGPFAPNLADVQMDGTQDLLHDAEGPAARTLAQPPVVFQGCLLSCPRPSTFGMIDQERVNLCSLDSVARQEPNCLLC